MDKIDYVLPYCGGKKVLDVGCANEGGKLGNRHKKIADASSRCIGIDVNEDALEALKEEGYDVEVANVEDFALGEKFEVVTAIEVFEHLENPGKALGNIRKHLVSNGVLVVTTPNPRYITRFLGDLWNAPGHVVYHHPESFRHLAKRYGFENERVQYVRSDDGSTNLRGRLLFSMPLPDAIIHNSWMGVFVKND